LKLTLEINDTSIIKWWVDASHRVNDDCRGHSGAVMSWGKAAEISTSNKIKIATRSSTEDELVTLDEHYCGPPLFYSGCRIFCTQNRFFITSLRAEYSARMIDFFIKMEVKILLLFCKLFCKQLTQNDSFRLILPYHLYIASELAKRDITLLVSWPKETANSHCNVISHVLGGRPCPGRTASWLKWDITLLVSWPKETANSHCNVISHVLGRRPCPRRTAMSWADSQLLF